MAGTPTSKILETIAALPTLQQTVNELAEVVERLARRVEALETGGKTPVATAPSA